MGRIVIADLSHFHNYATNFLTRYQDCIGNPRIDKSHQLAASGRCKAAGLRKLRRLCEAEVDKLRKGFALPTVKLYLSR